jgi:Ca2+-binding EF-hand superfamily protein
MNLKQGLMTMVGALALAGMSWADVGDFATHDRDGDGRITREEAQAFSQEKWQKFDANGNGTLERQEFNDGIFAAVDADNSGAIDRQEARMLANWGVEEEFDSLDGDSDTSITRAELDEALGENEGIFANWDLDSDDQIADNEWEDGFYGLFDHDDSGDIDENEWNKVSYDNRVASVETEADVTVTTDTTVAKTDTYGAYGEKSTLRAEDETTTMAAADTSEELPQTASPLALIGLIGASALGAASLLRRRN